MLLIGPKSNEHFGAYLDIITNFTLLELVLEFRIILNEKIHKIHKEISKNSSKPVRL